MAQKVKVSPGLIGGDVDEGYGKIADVFRRNFSSGQEVGPVGSSRTRRSGRKALRREYSSNDDLDR
jgi:hypothetical protein